MDVWRLIYVGSLIMFVNLDRLCVACRSVSRNKSFKALLNTLQRRSMFVLPDFRMKAVAYKIWGNMNDWNIFILTCLLSYLATCENMY